MNQIHSFLGVLSRIKNKLLARREFALYFVVEGGMFAAMYRLLCAQTSFALLALDTQKSVREFSVVIFDTVDVLINF